MINTKQCSQCHVEKPLSAYPSKSGRPSNPCRECKRLSDKRSRQVHGNRWNAERRARYHSHNREKILQRVKKYRENNREKKAATDRRYREKKGESLLIKKRHYYFQNPEKIKERTLRKSIKHKYGITLEEYNQLKDSSNQCHICNTEFGEKLRKNLDHCHATGKIRGILCQQCNVGIGCLKDDIERLSSAIEYIKKYSEGA